MDRNLNSISNNNGNYYLTIQISNVFAASHLNSNCG